MNFFELFEIPVQLKPDKTLLPKKYFELSKKYHPDFFTNESPEIQAEVLEKSALLNKALKTFQDPDETIKYVLRVKGLLEEEEIFSLPPGFLMQMMEINEQLMDAGNDPSIQQTLQPELDRLQAEIYEPVKNIIEHYQEGITTEKELLQVKLYYYQKKYLLRIQQQLNGKL
jgi:molecular chaperone HscB